MKELNSHEHRYYFNIDVFVCIYIFFYKINQRLIIAKCETHFNANY